VLQNEVPRLTLRLVDLPPGSTAAARAHFLGAEIAAAGSESEIVWTPLGRHVVRMRRGLPAVWANPGEAIAASAERPGIDRLAWRPLPERRLEPGEIEIDVRAAGVNFRDVMLTTGMLPEEASSDGFAGARLGLECAGVVRAVGGGVTEFAPGDRVAGFAAAALASRAITRADAVIALPPGSDFAAGATLPVAFVTAIYALRHLAQVQPGETVLIHAASGGVGLAAIQIAKGCGATVVATAGSAVKRAFLRLAGADHVCDSRELGFATAVREITGGTGVDVVLNSLHGEAAEASLDLLRPFGRFVELGKRDAYENRRLRLRSLRQNVSYFAVDVDQLPAHRPALAKKLLAEVAAALAAGDIRPLARREFAFAEIGEAFRLMQAAQHIGKLVLVPDGHAGIALSRPPTLVLDRGASYVVTGGIAGFGFAAARWLAERGAGHVALIGRRGAGTPGAVARVAELESLGAAVSLHAADAGDQAGLAAALAAIRGGGRPIRGIVHAAAAIADAMAADLDAEGVAMAFRAKLGGALLLDRLTGDDPLDFFWLFSSATTLVGAPGQGAYVAANHALEGLSRRRRAAGRPAMAIAWGPIADAGFLAERAGRGDALAHRLGARPMPAETALAALPAMAASGLPVVALADTAWNAARQILPILAAPLFEELRGALPGGAPDGPPEELAGLDDAARRALLEEIVAAETMRILRLADPVDRTRPLPELGMDSLMAVELRLAVEARLRIDLPLMQLAEGTSVAALASRLAEAVAGPPAAGSAAALAARYEAPLDPVAPGSVDLAADG
jgi:phthiocerol/phenolphthiocerol synthesis type-I polyketide synthase C